MANRWEENGNRERFYFLGLQNHSHEIKRHLLLGRIAYTNLDNVLKSREAILPIKVCVVKAMIFPVVMYGCENWSINKDECQRINWCFQSGVLEKTLESPLDSKDIKPVNPKGHQTWIFIGSTDAEAEALILQLPDVKSWLIGKDPDAGKDWRQKKGGSRRWDG